MRNLKAKLREQPRSLVCEEHEKLTAAVPIKSADPYIRGHIKELNDTVGNKINGLIH